MKAISLWEPWASAMALGVKHNETRSWPTCHRGDLVICAAKRPIDDFSWKLVELFGVDVETFQLGYGNALCVVDLCECANTEDFQGATPLHLTAVEAMLGNYEPRRFAWLTRNCRKLRRPVQVRGQQGLWTLNDATNSAILAQIQ
jgi:hypothetical protein